MIDRRRIVRRGLFLPFPLIFPPFLLLLLLLFLLLIAFFPPLLPSLLPTPPLSPFSFGGFIGLIVNIRHQLLSQFFGCLYLYIKYMYICQEFRLEYIY